ncbi:MAG: 16S rRNA (guanine(966)-N(2))-methyltransferase RsmD [Rhodoferax sp.]
MQKNTSQQPEARRGVPPRRARSPQLHEVRIIGGHWKRTKLKVVDRPGLRPTPDRVRETVFNWLGQDMTGKRCVDAFAGTGALGFEAASRGATEVLLVEQDALLAAQLETVRAQLLALQRPEPVQQSLRVQRGEGVASLRQLGTASQDVVFLDPPFDAGLYPAALAAAARALAPGGVVYLEAPTAWTDELLAPYGLVQHRHLKAGAVHAHVLRAA